MKDALTKHRLTRWHEDMLTMKMMI